MLNLSSNNLRYNLVVGKDATKGFRGITSQPETGLLFNHSGPMTMTGVAVPIDAAFIDKNGVIIDIQTMQPQVSEYRGRNGRYKQVLEASAGFFLASDWNMGDTVIFDDGLAYVEKAYAAKTASVANGMYEQFMKPDGSIIGQKVSGSFIFDVNHETASQDILEDLGEPYDEDLGYVSLLDLGYIRLGGMPDRNGYGIFGIEFTKQPTAAQMRALQEISEYRCKTNSISWDDKRPESFDSGRGEGTFDDFKASMRIMSKRSAAQSNSWITLFAWDVLDSFCSTRFKAGNLLTAGEDAILTHEKWLGQRYPRFFFTGSVWKYDNTWNIMMPNDYIQDRTRLSQIKRLCGLENKSNVEVMGWGRTSGEDYKIREANVAKYNYIKSTKGFDQAHKDLTEAMLENNINLPEGLKGKQMPIAKQRESIYDFLDASGAFDPSTYKQSSLYKQSDLSEEFMNWFEGSKVINSDGSPKILYKGNSRVDKMSGGFAESTYSNGGIYFSESPEVANKYTRSYRPNDEGEDPDFYALGIVPVYLKIDNPLDVTSLTDNKIVKEIANALDIPQSHMDECGTNTPFESAAHWLHSLETEEAMYHTVISDSILWAHIPQAIILGLQRLGYDGIKDVDSRAIVWIAFKPDQIYSALSQKSLALKKLSRSNTSNLDKYLSFDAYRYLIGPLSTRWGRDNVMAVVSNTSVEIVDDEVPAVTLVEFTDMQDSVGLSVIPAYIDESKLFVRRGYEHNDKWLVYAISRAVHRQTMGADWCPRLSQKDIVDILHLCGYRYDNIRKYTQVATQCVYFFRLDSMLAAMESLNYVAFIDDNEYMLSKWLKSIAPEPIRFSKSGIMHFLLSMHNANLDTLGKIGWPVISVNVEDALKVKTSASLEALDIEPIEGTIVQDKDFPANFKLVVPYFLCNATNFYCSDTTIPVLRLRLSEDGSIYALAKARIYNNTNEFSSPDILISVDTITDVTEDIVRDLLKTNSNMIWQGPLRSSIYRLIREGWEVYTDPVDEYIGNIQELKLSQTDSKYTLKELSELPIGSIVRNMFYDRSNGNKACAFLILNSLFPDGYLRFLNIGAFDDSINKETPDSHILDIVGSSTVTDVLAEASKVAIVLQRFIYRSYINRNNINDKLPDDFYVLRYGYAKIDPVDEYIDNIQELKLSSVERDPVSNLYSVVTIPRDSLSRQIWDNTDTEDPILKSDVKEAILSRLYNTLYASGFKKPKLWVKDVYLVGGIATLQYSKDSDIDVTVMVDLDIFSVEEDIDMSDDFVKNSFTSEEIYTRNVIKELSKSATSIFEKVLDNKARNSDVVWASSKASIYNELRSRIAPDLSMLEQNGLSPLLVPAKVDVVLAQVCHSAGLSDTDYWRISTRALDNINSYQEDYIQR